MRVSYAVLSLSVLTTLGVSPQTPIPTQEIVCLVEPILLPASSQWEAGAEPLLVVDGRPSGRLGKDPQYQCSREFNSDDLTTISFVRPFAAVEVFGEAATHGAILLTGVSERLRNTAERIRRPVPPDLIYVGSLGEPAERAFEFEVRGRR